MRPLIQQGRELVDLVASDTLKMDALWGDPQDTPRQTQRSVEEFETGRDRAAANSTLKRVVTLQQGIPGDTAREIVKYLRI